MKKDIKSLLPQELREELARLGEPAYRAGQIFGWLMRGESFAGMTNLPLSLRDRLDGRYYTDTLSLKEKLLSSDGTGKYLWELKDGGRVESVVMKYRHGNTVCISSQAGCRMGCVFCASTINGLERNLLPSEMTDQVIFSEREFGEPVSNIVLMGIGEPLDNFDNVIRFLKLITDPEGRGTGMRRIALSTCGLPERIDKLADYNLQLTLSVSLHAPDDETRDKIMPVNRSCGVGALLSACESYFKKTGRRVSLEYALIEGLNDTREHAVLLAAEAKKIGAHVNLIPLNPVAERGLTAPSREKIRAFAKSLEDDGVNVTIRRSMGADVSAACGQLRRRRMAGEPDAGADDFSKSEGL